MMYEHIKPETEADISVGLNEGEKQDSSFEVAADGTIEKSEPYPLKPALQKMVRDYFESKGYTSVEISETHVRAVSTNGKEIKIPNRIAIENAGGTHR